jgi:RNA polymerase sigma factor (sigma-70 family)
MAVSYSETEPYNELFWESFYTRMRPIVHNFVHTLKVSAWYGQEEDLVNDIIQETILRAIERVQKAKNGEAEEIRSFKYLTTKIAENYCRDLRRRDRRLCRTELSESGKEVVVPQETPLESATENIYQESIFATVAYEVAQFPIKQRQALLIDLANRMSFSLSLTPLQEAFLREGISLKQYQLPLPMDAQQRSRHTALLHCAYQRLARLPRIRAYLLEHRDDGEAHRLPLAS